MGRHKRGCGLEFPCPNGVHLSIQELESKIKELENGVAVGTDGEITGISPSSNVEPIVKTTPKIKVPVEQGYCHHVSHAGDRVLGEYQVGLGFSACVNHQCPQPPSNTMSHKQADRYSEIWRQWIRGFQVVQQ